MFATAKQYHSTYLHAWFGVL